MSDILRVMVKIWDMNTTDWLGYDNLERYSFHHLKKKCDGGEKIISNGAVLHQNSHSYLHTIEYYDLDKYLFLNGILRQINEQKYQPSIEQLKQIKLVLKEFQNEYDGKVSSRDKPIIKREYRLE
jgi:hypothetical protein